MYEARIRTGRGSLAISFLHLLSVLVAARPIHPPHSRRVPGELVAREGWDSHARIGEPVFVTITVPGGVSTTACLQMTGSSLDVCSEELPSPTATIDTLAHTEVPPAASTELPIPEPEPATGETIPAVPCDYDLPPPNRDPSASTSTTLDAIPSETRYVVIGLAPSVVVDLTTVIPPSALPTLAPVEQEPMTTIHIFTTITEFIISTPTAQPPNPDPPSFTPSGNRPFPPLPTPEGQFTSPSAPLPTPVSYPPGPVPEGPDGLDTGPEGSGPKEPATGIDIVPV